MKRNGFLLFFYFVILRQAACGADRGTKRRRKAKCGRRTLSQGRGRDSFPLSRAAGFRVFARNDGKREAVGPALSFAYDVASHQVAPRGQAGAPWRAANPVRRPSITWRHDSFSIPFGGRRGAQTDT